MKIHGKSAKIYLSLHAALILALFLFPVYQKLAKMLSNFLSGCFLHDRLFLYCPLCGGTRALSAFLHLDFRLAWQYNALVTVMLCFAIVLDVVALIRLLRGKQKLLPLPERFWIVLVILMLLYGILRNFLMIAYGYDPVGDLAWFWQAIRSGGN